MPDAAETSTDIYDSPDNLKEGEVREVNDSTADAEKAEAPAEEKVEEKQEEVKAEEGSNTEEKVVPESYEYTQEEDANLTEEDLVEISEYCKEKGFSQEEAQEFMEQQEISIKKHMEKQAKQLDAMQDKWESQVEADEEIGGENLKKNVELSRRVFEKFGSEELFKLLSDTRWGSHPEVVRFGVRLGNAMADDVLLTGDNAPKKERSMEDIFYGSN